MERFVAKHGIPPTVREIAGHFGLSPPTVHEMLMALEEKGCLRRADRGSRALMPASVRHHSCPCVEIPLVGVIAAGRPIEAIEDRTALITVRKDLLRGRPGFALRVKGDSMIEAGILDGDTVIIRQQGDAQDGDIVVALLGDEATLKRFRQDRHGITLVPANRCLKPIRVLSDDFRVQGVVVSVERIFAS
jgi:repressor LexA